MVENVASGGECGSWWRVWLMVVSMASGSEYGFC